MKNTLAIVLCFLFLASSQARVVRTSGLIAEKTQWENPYYIIKTGVPGPTLLITGGIHGNEPAGSRAADQIRNWTPGRGTLIVVPRVNTPGLRQNTRWLPGQGEATRNANRNFPRTGAPDEARTIPVQAVWEFIKRQKPDWVVDLHEGIDFHIANSKSDGSSIVYFDRPPVRGLAAKILVTVNSTIDDPKRKFVSLTGGPVAGGLVRATIERLGAQGFCFETTFSKQPLSTRTRQHRLMVHCLMQELGMAPGGVNVMTDRGSTASPTIQVALHDAAGTGGKGIRNIKRILEPETPFALHHVGAEDIRTGALEQFDVVIFPGGSGSKQARALGSRGREAVRNFVESGGGYIGICGGAFLATAKYDWSLALINARTFTGKKLVPGQGMKSMWVRGSGTVEIELTDEGKKRLLDRHGVIKVHYQNGPILSPAGDETLPPYVPLAFYRSEISKYNPQRGTMVDTPAIIASPFGHGRVMAISPHPEDTEGLESFIERAVLWAAGKR